MLTPPLTCTKPAQSFFYDALILASAHVAGCKLLYSEDMNAGEVVAGVRVVNPFR
jgi:predicted nucleic acid-binding protein